MNITASTIRIADQQKDCLVIKITESLTGNDTHSLREEVAKSLNSVFDTIYIDAKDVTKIDLSGINEVIHSSYTLKNASKKLIFAYKMKSEIEKWVETTGLQKFMETAINPA